MGLAGLLLGQAHASAAPVRAQLLSPKAQPAVPDGESCLPAQLRVIGALGTYLTMKSPSGTVRYRDTVLEFQNISAVPCILVGTPEVHLTTGDGKTVPYRRSSNSIADAADSGGTLLPGRVVELELGWFGPYCGRPRTATATITVTTGTLAAPSGAVVPPPCARQSTRAYVTDWPWFIAPN